MKNNSEYELSAPQTMSLKDLKRACSKARRTLIDKHGYRADQFIRSDGTETLYAPNNIDQKHNENGFLEPGALKGTWLLWSKVSYEYDEWDASLPTEVLSTIEFYENASIEELLGHCKEDGHQLR